MKLDLQKDFPKVNKINKAKRNFETSFYLWSKTPQENSKGVEKN